MAEKIKKNDTYKNSDFIKRESKVNDVIVLV